MIRGASLRVTAVGDVSFEGSKADRPSFDCFRETVQLFAESDLVIANLENPLTDKGEPAEEKCTLRSSPKWAPVMRHAGINVVTLANNHLMDYGEAGLFETLAALDRAGIRHVGAGRTRLEACAPLFLDVGSNRIALLARSSVIIGARAYADDRHAGVAFLDEDELIANIRRCKAGSDLVILLLHWGIEEHQYPSPAQRRLARRCVDAGADVILGHHPHVVQGVEQYRSAPIIYSLGNFVFNEFEWMYSTPGGSSTRHVSRLGPDNRKGAAATIEWTGKGRPDVRLTTTIIDADGFVHRDPDPGASQALYRRSRRLQLRPYSLMWAWHALTVEWNLRLASRLSLRKVIRNLHRARPSHVRELFDSIRRSARIVLQRSTNPYE